MVEQERHAHALQDGIAHQAWLHGWQCLEGSIASDPPGMAPSPALQHSGSAARSGRSTPVPEPEQGPPPKRPRQVKTDQVSNSQYGEGGQTDLQAVERQQGCRGCKDHHQCDVRPPNGQACGATSHNRLNHPKAAE